MGTMMTPAQVATVLAEMGERIRTQDNRITHLPIFVVQQRKRVYGFDTAYSVDDRDIAWLLDGREEADAEEKARLEAAYQETGKEPQDCTRTAFVDEWIFVQPFFTEAGAQRYIDENRHNLTDPRIYAASGYRNREWEAVRQLLEHMVTATAEERDRCARLADEQVRFATDVKDPGTAREYLKGRADAGRSLAEYIRSGQTITAQADKP